MSIENHQQQAFIPADGSLITEIIFFPFSKVEFEFLTNLSASFRPTAFLIFPYKSPKFVILSKSYEISFCFFLIYGANFSSPSEMAFCLRHNGMLSKSGSEGLLLLMSFLTSSLLSESTFKILVSWSLSFESLADLSLPN